MIQVSNLTALSIWGRKERLSITECSRKDDDGLYGLGLGLTISSDNTVLSPAGSLLSSAITTQLAMIVKMMVHSNGFQLTNHVVNLRTGLEGVKRNREVGPRSATPSFFLPPPAGAAGAGPPIVSGSGGVGSAAAAQAAAGAAPGATKRHHPQWPRLRRSVEAINF